MVHSQAVSLDEVQAAGNLLTLDNVREKLSTTEPLSEVVFTPNSGVTMRYESGWAGNTVGLTDPTGAYLRMPGGQEYQFTKQGAMQLGSECRITRGYQEAIPPDLLEQNVNWWLSNGLGDKELKLLASQDRALALTRATVSPFSNLRLLDTILTRIENRYGEGEVLADYKFYHDLEATALRLIIPGQRRIITGTSLEDDSWSVGVELKNSLIGLKQTELSGYLFRHWCTNGCVDTAHASGGFKRRGSSEEDALVWAAESVDEILGGLEPALDSVQELVNQPVAGDVVTVLNDLFDRNNLPVRERRRVIDAMADTDEMTMYSVMQAVTQAANLDGLDRRSQQYLLNMGGHIAHTHGARCGECHRLLPEAN